MAFERNLLLVGHDVRGAPVASKLEAPGDVVVVYMRLEDMSEFEPTRIHDIEHPVDVSLGIYDCGDRAVRDEVAAVAQRGGVECGDVEAVHAPSLSH